MPEKSGQTITATLLTDDAVYSLAEFCARCHLTEAQVKAYVFEGILMPEGDNPAEWRFSRLSLVEARRACRLERDLGLNPAGVALALELMRQIDALTERLRRLEGGDA